MSSIDLVRFYWTQRYPTRVYLPLAVLILVAGAVGLGAPVTPWSAASGVVIAYTLVLLFRVWDDLADRHVDRERHPERVMVQARDTSAFVGLIVALALIAVTLVALRESWDIDLAALTLLALALAGWYALRVRLAAGPLANAHVILLKYPAIAFIASPPASSVRPAAIPLLAALGALYLGLCIHELLDDPVIRARRHARSVVATELGLLAGLQLLVLSTGGLRS